VRISHLKTNRITDPLGFAIDPPVLSWIVEDTPDKSQQAAQVLVARDPEFQTVLFDSGKVEGQSIDSLAFRPELTLEPRRRYTWKVRVWGETEFAESERAWFETAKMGEPWEGSWISPDFHDNQTHPILWKDFSVPKGVVSARAYVCGLGLYHFELNGQKVGDEVLTPNCNAYDQWIQYQTYDITGYLTEGQNTASFMVGNGWYKGRYGLQDFPAEVRSYGDQFALIAELRFALENGEEWVIGTDGTWRAKPAPVLESDIYDGETYDARLADSGQAFGVVPADLDLDRLETRRSLPVVIMEEIKPVAVIHTPAGETVLDMGQNMVGWVRFRTDAPEGAEIRLQFGEVLQEGNFYRENLRSARAEYVYIADGAERVVQPTFTFFGFRYVKVSGWVGDLDIGDFTGCVVYSRLETIGHIETSNPKVNQLFKNALWGQKGNFLDIPTDCPQRDERLGWTGDTQVFAGTACFNMDSAAFFAKFTYDLAQEQNKFDGRVPYTVPDAHLGRGGSSAWGDAATIVPWTVYEFYGDRSILAQQFESMRAWVDYIKGEDDASGSKRLWTTGFHFGDWLALDGNDTNSPMGGTPEDFISSAYYFKSAQLVARAASVLGKKELAEQYAALAAEIKTAIQNEYFTPTGRLAINTQTGYTLALFMDLVPEEFRQRVMDDLVSRLRKDKVHLRTGFVGTPYICRVLSENGANDLAYQLLLNEDYPSWLYAVNLGATTIWERWNSLNPDGTISSSGMNSLNHYAYGSIVEWMYREMYGLNPSSGDDAVTGFRHAQIAPKPDKALAWARASYLSAAGLFESGWEIDQQGNLCFEITIPFNAEAQVVLPDAEVEDVSLNGEPVKTGRQVGDSVVLKLRAGRYVIDYTPTRPYSEVLSTYSPIPKLLQNKKAAAFLAEQFPAVADLDEFRLAAIGNACIREIAETPFIVLTEEQMDELDRRLQEMR